MKKFTIIFTLILGLSVIGISAQTSDSAAPKILELDLTPDSVDVRSNSQTVSFTARVTDEASGVSRVTLYLFPGFTDYIIPLKLERISGDGNDGIYIGMITIVAFETARTWNLTGIESSDAAGNKIFISGSQFAQLGFATSFQVISNSPPTPPFNKRKRIRFIT
jgi:hypothetical protein